MAGGLGNTGEEERVVSLSVCLSVCLSDWLAGWMDGGLPVCLSVCLSVWLAGWLAGWPVGWMDSGRKEVGGVPEVAIYVLLTAARATPSYTRSNGAAVRDCIEYGFAQSRSQ